ncbi:PREDICTED: melanoma-associated antigen B10-like [Miniopterus natalensis]|uniref:melanoma-associated antigen B10-like n=1 Tax=Miniopterus natalensis TaxID=291302 RepID=UPI0007A70711|nr:PREDICTED: melanoma-associated antigen B10-like [Miniopterus natalensis]
MPQGQLCAPENSHQAQEEPENLEGAQATPRLNEGANHQVEERPRSSRVLSTTEILRDPLNEKVHLLVYYLLYKYQIKEPIITKGEILRNVIQMDRNNFLEIFKSASQHLELVFGLEMKEADPYQHIYVVVNKLNLSLDVMLNNDRGVPKTGLLLVVLSVIFMNGNCATEELVWEMLNVMGLYPGRKHFIFGEPKKLITRNLVQENYLEYRQVPASDPPSYEFLWGSRAHTETTKMKVLEFLAKICDTVPTTFPSLYEEALRDEEERARAAARARSAAMARARNAAMAGARSRATGMGPSHP